MFFLFPPWLSNIPPWSICNFPKTSKSLKPQSTLRNHVGRCHFPIYISSTVYLAQSSFTGLQKNIWIISWWIRKTLIIDENHVLLTNGVQLGWVLMALLSNALLKSWLLHSHFRHTHCRSMTEQSLNKQGIVAEYSRPVVNWLENSKSNQAYCQLTAAGASSSVNHKLIWRLI